MGDMGDVFRGMQEASKERRANNREGSAELLVLAAVPFVSKNGGAHLIVDGRIDFWPGTGLWMDRKSMKKRRGVQDLIRHVNNTKRVEQGNG